MQIRCESASNKQHNILVNNHQGTRCFGRSASAGAAEESEERSYLLRCLKVYSFEFSPSPTEQMLYYTSFIKTNTKRQHK